MFDLSYLWMEFECPNCNYIDEVQLIDIKNEQTIFCHNCKTSIQLKDSESSVHNGVDKINQAMNDIENLFKNFGK